jgi:hypothetical protein
MNKMTPEKIIITITALVLLAFVGGCWAFDSYLNKKEKK